VAPLVITVMDARFDVSGQVVVFLDISLCYISAVCQLLRGT
jgi:hypothetical protein